MKFGFELEFFCEKVDPNWDGVLTEGQIDSPMVPCLVPSGLPLDECGWLVEVRSEPHSDIRKAFALLDAEVESVKEQAKKKGIRLIQRPLYEIPRALKVEAARLHTKGLIRYQNIYGHETHRCPTKLATASLHISFTNERVKTFQRESFTVDGKYIRTSKYTEEFRYQGFVDHAKIFVGLDVAFAKEIRAAQRNPGFYEVKHDGRIEYRSLPNDIDLNKVREVLEKLCK
jgi:hypothetical protein